MSIDLLLIKKKWKIILFGWFGLFIVFSIFIIIVNPSYPDLVKSNNGILQAEGDFCSGGKIFFSMSPIKSVNGWHKSTISITPLFNKAQKKNV